MKIVHRVLDYSAPGNGLGAPELPMTLICIQRALLMAEVPGIRCTNQPNGEQRFETADGYPVHLFMTNLMDKAHKGEEIPLPREVLAMFGVPCFSPLPCGSPVKCDYLYAEANTPAQNASDKECQ